MRSVWSVPLAVALVVAGAGLVQAQQPYPAQFANQWTNSCLSSCQSNPLYKGRERLCPSYCTCVVQESQASIPIETVMQAERDLQAKNNQSPAVQRMNQVAHRCQARVLPPQQPLNQGKTKR
ncbi:MAG: hypothetical protein KIT36_10140 [Alphaproteobacteria bacterium]|nr:hypothetical protein [Alphaproteobacteria bacterium]